MYPSTIHQANLNRGELFFPNQTSTTLQKIYVKSDHAWSYLGKIIILTRHLLNAAGKSCYLISLLGKDLPQKVKETTTRLKLFSIVGVPFSLISLKSISEKIFRNFLSQNKEGIALGSLSFAITITDVFDSMTTFVNTTLSFSGHTPIESLSALGIPLGFAMSGMGTVLRIIQITKAYQVRGNVNAIRKEILRTFDEEDRFGKVAASQNSQNLSGRSIAAFLTNEALRTIPGEIELKLRKLYSLITVDRDETFTDQQFNEISQVLDDIQDLLKKKFITEGLGISANTLIISALCLFCLGSLSSLPFLLLALSFFIRISLLTYQDLT